VLFLKDCVGSEVEAATSTLSAGRVALLENLRFHAGEAANDAEFAGQLSALADLYVNDAFGTAHRAHASTVGVPARLGGGAAGLLIEKELEYLARALYEARHPVVVILGGAKVSGKIDVIENLMSLADTFLLGGGMAFTFLKSQGKSMGASLVEEEKLEVARSVLEAANRRQISFELPRDTRIVQRMEAGATSRVVDTDAIPEGWMGVDIGPKTIRRFESSLSQAQTIIWNGPLGVFEIEDFALGTLEIARAVAASSAMSVIGGGDSALAIKRAGVEDKISHISTGGGASLDFLAGKKLPGIEALSPAP
jgi:3-phosphoglycerate kinase